MLDFRRKSRLRNYTSQREQRRLFVLVLVSGLTVLLVIKAANPLNWRWLLSGDAPRTAQQADGARDTRLPQVRDSDAPGVFVARRVSPDADQADEQPDAAAQDARKLFPGVRADYLARVRDDTVFDPADQDGMYHLLALLRETDPQQIDAASTGQVSFAQLDKQPREYRGQIVSIGGIVHGAQRFEAPANAYGIESYYQLWLEPTAGPSLPIVIYALELPRGYPEGMDLRAETEVTGFFFKRWAYRAQDGIRSAPLILARTVKWHPPLPAGPVANWPDATLLGVALLVALTAAGLATLALYRGRRAPVAAHAAADDASVARALDALADEPLPPTVAETMQNRAGEQG